MSQRRTVEVSCKRSIQGSPRVPTSPKGSAQSLAQLGPTAQWGRLRKRGQRVLRQHQGHVLADHVVDCYWELAPLPEENSSFQGVSEANLHTFLHRFSLGKFDCLWKALGMAKLPQNRLTLA